MSDKTESAASVVMRLNDEVSEFGSPSGCASSGVDITAITKLKHADLWAAAKQLGSQAALARYLGISEAEVGTWVNLKRCPPAEPNGKRWTQEFLTELERKLLALTGKLLDELFPPELRENAEFLDCAKSIEQTARIRGDAMSQYALATRERFERIGNGVEDERRHDERRDAIGKVLDTLSYREREIIKMRFGIDQPNGQKSTRREVGCIFKVSQSRVEQIEKKALRKMKNPLRADVLREYA